MVGKTISHYRILAKAGEGGMGVVYKAEDTRLLRSVALKLLPPTLLVSEDDRNRFLHEARASAALSHPNIATVFEIDESEAGMFIAYEFIDGQTLAEKVASGPLKLNEVLSVAVQACEGLQAAHEKGIVHRDIKCENIMVTTKGQLKILDFGLAKLRGTTVVTKAGTILGTMAYMSPEQLRGEVVDQRTDIWALGVVLYELVAGQRPFRASYEDAVAYQITSQHPEPLTAIRSGVPMELERIVRKCLSKDPRERYQHTDELLVDLLSCSKASALPPATTPPLPGTGQRRRNLFAIAGASVIVLAVIAYFVLPRANSPGPRLKKIAVLPFENLGRAEDEYFADGLSYEIISRLSSIHGLGVISRTSSSQYKKTSKTLPVVGKELGVDYILEGTIRWEKTGGVERIRITPELIQISGDVHLWADNIDRTLDDIFALQTEIATNVVKSLDLVLSENETRIIAAMPTRNPEAYQTYLRGLSFSNRYERSNLEMAVEMFSRAVALDSTFALAYAELSMADMLMYWFGFDHTSERFALARESLNRALALQNDLPEAYLAQGYYSLWGSRDYDRAREAFDSAERMLPNSSRAIEALGSVLRRQGKFAAAIERYKRSFELDPQNANLPLEIGNTLRMQGIYPDAVTCLDRSISLLPDQSVAYIVKAEIDLLWHGDTKKSRSELERIPTQYRPWLNLTWLDIYDRAYQSALDRVARQSETIYEDHFSIIPVTLMRGMIFRFMNEPSSSRASFDSARVYLESEVEKRPEDYRLHSSLGIVYAGLGRYEAAVREAELGAGQLPVTRDAWAGVLPVITLAQVYTMVGRDKDALDKLEYLLSTQASREITPHMLQLDPTYDSLRGNKRFQALLAKGEDRLFPH